MKKGYLFIAITTVLFSSMEIALKFISGAFNPIQLTFSRFFIGGIVLLPFAYEALKKKGLRIRWHDVGAFALCGLVGIALSMSLYQGTEQIRLWTGEEAPEEAMREELMTILEEKKNNK